MNTLRKWFDPARLDEIQPGDDLIRTILYLEPETPAHEIASLTDGQILGLDPNPEASGGNAHMHFSSVFTPNLDIVAVGIETVVTTSNLNGMINRPVIGGMPIAGPVLGENSNVIGLVLAEDIDEVIYLNPECEDLLDQVIEIEKKERESFSSFDEKNASNGVFQVISGKDIDG